MQNPSTPRQTLAIARPCVLAGGGASGTGDIGKRLMKGLSYRTMTEARTCITAACLALSAIAAGQDADQTPSVRQQLSEEAAALTPLVGSQVATRFLAAVPDLPPVEPRVVWWNGAERRALRPEAAESMSPEALQGFKRRELDERFYYYTAFGTPLAYCRALDLAAGAGFRTAAGKRIVDFGYGGIGQLRLLASLGADVTGIEVLDLLRDLYREPGDTGSISRSAAAEPGPPGRLALVHGRFPAEPATVEAVGGGVDLFLTKNVLKKGYVHPEREADPRVLVDLGTDDETFVRAVYDALAEGGLFVIYNLYPPQAPPEEPYIPHATGSCPFDRSLVESTGFEVVAFDADDTAAARAMGKALGWGESMDLENGLFGMYTILRK